MVDHLVEMADYWPPFQHVKMTKKNVDMADDWPPFQHVKMTKKKGGYGELLAAISTCWINKKRKLK